MRIGLWNMKTHTGSDMPCSLTRRSLAIGYDIVAVLTLWFAATAVLLPFTGVPAIEPGQDYYFLYPPCLLLVNWLYLALSWRHGNQTLGMKAWRLFLRSGSDERISWGNTVSRYSVAVIGFAAMGAGFISSLFRPDKLTWQDRASDSWPVFRPLKS